MSRDPENGKLLDPKTLHKYLYASGNPVNRIDPSGKDDSVQVAIIIAAVHVLAVKVACGTLTPILWLLEGASHIPWVGSDRRALVADLGMHSCRLALAEFRGNGCESIASQTYFKRAVFAANAGDRFPLLGLDAIPSSGHPGRAPFFRHLCRIGVCFCLRRRLVERHAKAVSSDWNAQHRSYRILGSCRCRVGFNPGH